MKHKMLLPVLLLLSHAGAASAAVSAVSFTAPGGIDHASNDVTGYRFTVGSLDIMVSALGFWDEGGDGLTNDHDVAIYSVETEFFETLTTVPSGLTGELLDGFRYAEVDPVTLFAGETYVILGYRPTGADGVTYLTQGTSIAPFITLDDDIAANFTGRLRYTNQPFGLPEGGWYGPNFRAEPVAAAVPESGGGMAVFLTGMAAVLGLHRCNSCFSFRRCAVKLL